MNKKPKYNHSFSLNFEFTSELEGCDEAEAQALLQQAQRHLRQQLTLNKLEPEWLESKPCIKEKTVTKKDYIYMSIIYNTKDGFYKQDDFKVPADVMPDALRDYFSVIDDAAYEHEELDVVKWTDSYTTWDGVKVAEALCTLPLNNTKN